jgi:NADPH-dependent glutamate synthase beta subunit-like oxidoreductase
MANPEKRIPSIWTTGWTDVLNTGTWRNAIAVHQKRPAPCHGTCPVNGEIPTWVQHILNKEFFEGWRTLVENNPLPAAIGRTCHHPCETACNRQEHDGAISINALEHYIGDMAIQEGWHLPAPEAELSERVAVIGGGPAGLSCAYQLRRRGFQVTIYDANPELGGVLRYGVPEYRLPKHVINAETKRISDLGVEVVPGRKITGADLDAIEKEYAAVFIAFGAHDPKTLPQFPRNDSRVLDGIAFLRSVRLGTPMKLGRNVVVIGGGSVAMDVAGSALRLGSSASIVALESRSVMPAPADEIQDALDEGARLIDGAMVRTVEDAAGILKLHCIRVDLDPDVPVGVIRPLEIEGTDFPLEAETVILAIGQDPEIADWETSVKIENSMISIDAGYMTSRTGVFAAGDVASSERFVSTAIGEGKRAALNIARYLLRQDDMTDRSQEQATEVAFADINTFYFPPKNREEREKNEARERNADFREIKLGYSAEQARAQAERCFSCGSCLKCDNCFYFCPDMAIVKDSSSPVHYGVLDQYCKGCGCCLEECPRGAMGVKEETK